MSKLNKKYLLCLLTGVFLLANFSYSFAHPGNTDSSGCHTCRTNCPNWGLSYGEYHCHRSKGVVQPKEPVKSIRNVNGNGITVPAPEYKIPNNNTKKVESTKIVEKPVISIVNVEKRGWVKKLFSWLF